MNQKLLTITERKLLKCFDRSSIRIRIPRLVINQSKRPLIPNWPNFYEPWAIEKILEQGYNWGVRTGKKIGNYYFIVIDLDDIWAKERIQVPRYVKTANGLHVYCLIKELIPYLILVNKHQIRIGEIHGTNRQVVGIGSIHKSGKRYSLVGKNNAPWFLKFASLAELATFLNQKGIFFKNNKVSGEKTPQNN